jgi:hypothetical protein
MVTFSSSDVVVMFLRSIVMSSLKVASSINPKQDMKEGHSVGNSVTVVPSVTLIYWSYKVTPQSVSR